MVGIALLGAGTIGSSFYRCFNERRDSYSAEVGDEVRIVSVAVKDRDKKRSVDIEPSLLTTTIAQAILHPDTQVVVSVLGDVEMEYKAIMLAIRNGKRVVTANKFVIAKHGPELFALARGHCVEIFFEAAVCGSIQVVDNLLTRYIANEITGINVIANGTTNFILWMMKEWGLSYEQALAQAQALGYAEPDPSADVNGSDAAQKIAIIASLIGRGWVNPDDVACKGIDTIFSELTLLDLRYAREFGYVLKLIATAQKKADGVGVRVWPTFVSKNHPLAHVEGAMNAVDMVGQPIQTAALKGPGAGGDPTSASLLADMLNAAAHVGKKYIQPMPDMSTRLTVVEPDSSYWIAVSMHDEPGALAKILTAIGDLGVNVEEIRQSDFGKLDDVCETVIVTNAMTSKTLHTLKADVEALPVCRGVRTILPALLPPRQPKGGRG